MTFFDKLANKRKSKKVGDKNHIYFKWLRWIKKLAARKGIESDVDICGYGKTHLVSKPQKIGTGWMFWSKGCSGCKISAEAITAAQAGNKNIPNGAPNCAFLISTPLFSMEEVKEGQLVSIRKPHKHSEKDNLRKVNRPQEFIRAIPREEQQQRRRAHRPPRLANNPNRARPVVNIENVPQNEPLVIRGGVGGAGGIEPQAIRGFVENGHDWALVNDF